MQIVPSFDATHGALQNRVYAAYCGLKVLGPTMLIQDLSLRCPCCDHKTLSERGEFEICAICFWEDDGQDDDDADEVLGGPNGDLSLTQARANYQQFGASRKQDLPHVRPPRPEES